MMMDLVRVEGWAGIAGLRHGFTGRRGGVSQCYGPGELNLGFTKEDDPVAVAANRAAVLAEVGGEEMAMVKQVHSAKVVRVGRGFGQGVVEADGMVTDEPGVLLAVQAADCVPVIVADPGRRVCGAFHAGWRGTAAGIVRVGIEAMIGEFGCRVEDLWVAVGPSIGACCYEVGGEVMGAFSEEAFEVRGGKTYLDLWEANRGQALAAGVPASQVAVVGECTGCSRGGGWGKAVLFASGGCGEDGARGWVCGVGIGGGGGWRSAPAMPVSATMKLSRRWGSRERRGNDNCRFLRNDNQKEALATAKRNSDSSGNDKSNSSGNDKSNSSGNDKSNSSGNDKSNSSGNDKSNSRSSRFAEG